MALEDLEALLEKKEKTLVVQVAPAIRVSIGELFGMEAGIITTKKLVWALKKLGFDYVFDTSFGADVAVVEEAKEIAERIEKNGPFPVINSCCSGTVVFLEHAYPDLVQNMASVKSPMEIVGSLIKSYFAESKKIPKENIHSTAVMPCVIKKTEANRPELKLHGMQVIDKVITTVELANLMKKKGIDLNECEEAEFDALLGTASGGGYIFGSSGGITEAALREFAFMFKLPIEKIETSKIRGSEGMREITFQIGEKTMNIAIVNSLRNAGALLNDKERVAKYQFIEIMACLGGCVGGAGQPPSTLEKLEKRRKGLYNIDADTEAKASSENPEIIALYKNYLGEPGSKRALELLHINGFAKICEDCF